MKGDFTRFTFKPEKHYRSVRVQQGRVQLDADWNEQADIATHRDDTAAGDLIGHQGGPWNGGGFQVGQFVVPRTLYAVHFASATLGFAVGAEGAILKTTDGVNWTRQVSSTIQPLRGICAVASGAGFAVGEAGTVLFSANGNTWAAQSVPSSATLHGVYTLDGAMAIAVGDGGAILQTKNAAAASPVWSAIGPTAVAANLHAIHVIQVSTTTHIFIVGEGGIFLHGSITSAGGDVTWDAPLQKVSVSLNGVHFVTDKDGFAVGAPAVGESRTIWKIGDSGSTWTAQQVANANVTVDLRGVRFAADAKTGVIVGDEGTILFTADGTTWNLQTLQPAVTGNLRSVSVAGQVWHAVGDGSAIVGSNDGKAWATQTAPSEWAISPGHLYVDGILCENERYVGLSAQPDGDPIAIDKNQLIYLDVWERHLTAFDRPELREVALGGPDTTTRLRTIWQLKTTTAPQGGCATADTTTWTPNAKRSTGRLAARAAPVPPITDICLVPPSGGYRRLENQLYRIEIVDAGDTTKGGTPTFTWSRDNGSTIAPIDRVDGTTIKLLNPGINPVALSGFAGASVVEVVDDPSVMGGKPGAVVSVNPIQDSTLTVADPDKGKALPHGPGAIVRRWESKPINVQTGQWIELGIDRGGGQIDKEGIQVRFDAGSYNTGDYWVIPARTLTGSIEWPSDDGEALFKSPDGVLHHFCPLAITDSANPTVISDCRGLFPWLPGLSSVSYVGGDGQEVMPNQPLIFPLQVSVPLPAATVRFTPLQGTISAGGQSANPPNHLDVNTNDRIAQVNWTLTWDPAVAANQRQVEAVLLDPSGFKRGRPVRFSATLAQAKNTYYDPTACQGLAGKTNVQDAIDQILGLTTIRYVSGDGQQALPYRPLAQPLQVGVSSTCGPVAATVRFTADGNGRLAPQINQFGSAAAVNPLDVQAVNGIAGCAWLPDPRSKQAGQHVQAQLLDKNSQPTGIPVMFTTSLSPGLHVVKLALGVGRPFDNDMVVNPADLAQGIVVECDGAIAEAAARPPILTVTLDVPYPIVPVDREFFGIAPTPGPSPLFTPMVMAAQVSISGSAIRWMPTGEVLKLTDRLVAIGESQRLTRFLARLVIYGNAIWSSEGRLNLDGDVLLGLDEKPSLHLPSGDGQLGGNFEMWFWLGRQ